MANYEDGDDNRVGYLQNISSTLVEDVRQLNNYLSGTGSQEMLTVREIDRKGYPYDYQIQTKLALDQYVTKALELLFESRISLANLRG